MPGSTISITFAVNGKETILDLTKGVDGIRKAMEATVTEADLLQKKVIKPFQRFSPCILTDERYSEGDMPVERLKYLPKNDCVGKLRL